MNNDEYKRLKRRQALENIVKRRQAERAAKQTQFAGDLDELKRSKVKMALSEVMSSGKDPVSIQKGVTDKISTKDIVKQVSQKEFAAKPKLRTHRAIRDIEKAFGDTGSKEQKKAAIQSAKKVLADVKGDKELYSKLSGKIQDLLGGGKAKTIAKTAGKAGKFAKMAGKVGKKIPVLGTIMAAAGALHSGDAAAATGDILIPGGLEGVGATQKGTIADVIENPGNYTKEQRRKIQEILMRREALQKRRR